ncbi:MAG: hypothetical protein QHJ73_12005 [Armatimonadota bacterium]|nr:hypothetical protein [Armatimonadota bacterium]
MKPRVYVDFDDVLCETARALTQLLAARFGKRVAYEEIHSFDLGVSFGLNAEELRRLMDGAHEEAVIRGLDPVPGAREVLARWYHRGYEICVVTGRPPSTMHASRAWLAQHAIPYHHLYFVDKYARLAPGPDLLALEDLARVPFSLAVEDAPAMLEFLLRRMHAPVVIFHRPWNAAFPDGDLPPGRWVRRCRSWEEVAATAEEVFKPCIAP